jgi:thiamine biosynthesis protein ThiS
MNDLEIILNGEPRTVPGPATLAELLRHLELDPRSVVVELNRQIIRRGELDHTPLASGDSVEVVHFVGGG